MRALFILDYGNPLYTRGKSVRTAEAREAFARWAVAAAKHFSGRGINWEVFNEPNHPIFWPPKPNVNEYAALAVEVLYQPPFWVHALLWLPLILITTLLPLRPIKGLLIALQYHHKAEPGRLVGGDAP